MDHWKKEKYDIVNLSKIARKNNNKELFKTVKVKNKDYKLKLIITKKGYYNKIKTSTDRKKHMEYYKYGNW